MVALPYGSTSLPSLAEGGEKQASGRRPWPAVAVGAFFATVATVLIVSGQQQPIEALGGIAPGTQLELQTSRGPMALTVDSAMNAEGYVHAHGFKGGQEYAGFVKLTAAQPQQGPMGAPQQLAAQQPMFAAAQGPYYGAQQQQMAGGQAPYYGAQQQQLVQQQGGVAPREAASGGAETLSISRSGAVSINGEPMVAANSRTAAILRLLAKQASGRAAPPQQQQRLAMGAGRLNGEIDRATSLLSHLRANRALSMEQSRSAGSRHHQGSREAMWAAMQSLMSRVDKVADRQAKMAKTVDKVRRVMRYQP